MLADAHSAQRMMGKIGVHVGQVTAPMATTNMAACRQQDPPKTQSKNDIQRTVTEDLWSQETTSSLCVIGDSQT